MLQHPDYIIEKEIGQGGMATVYLAHDKVFKCPVAIKILNKELLHNEHVRSRFLDEARKIYRMNHPNIIRVTRIIEEEQGVAFVMEHINGATLKEHIEAHGRLGNDEIVRFMVQMLDALQYVHKQGLVHRDVKPSNFMIDSEGQLKLLDFGIAKNNNPGSAEYTQTAAASQMGTPMYMSPEQINEAKSVTAQSDIYSLGVVLWYMVMGERPYNTNSLSTFQLLSKIVHEELRDTGTIFQPIIRRCTQKNLDERYADCEQVKADLLKLPLEGSVTPVSDSGRSKPGSPDKKTNTDESTRVVFFPDDKKEKRKQSAPAGFFAEKRNRLLAAAAGFLLIAIVTISLLFSGKKDTPVPAMTADPQVPADTIGQAIPTSPSADSLLNPNIPEDGSPASDNVNLPATTNASPANNQRINTKIPDRKKINAQQVPAGNPVVPAPQTEEVVKTPANQPAPAPDAAGQPAQENDPAKKKKFFQRVGDGIKKVFKKKNKDE